MYSESREKMMTRKRKLAGKPAGNSGIVAPRPNAAHWAGRFVPGFVGRVRPSGMLADDDWTGNTGPQQSDIEASMTPIAPREALTFPTIGTVPSVNTTVPVVASGSGNAWDSLFGGIAKIITPGAQAFVGIKTQETLQKQHQQSLINTWNPALTGPALQAQAYQNAFMSGSGVSPISTTTLIVGGLGLLGLFLAMSHR